MEGKQSRQHQDKDLICTQDLLGAQSGLFAAQHVLASLYTEPLRGFSGCFTEHPDVAVGAVPCQAQAVTGEPA